MVFNFNSFFLLGCATPQIVSNHFISPDAEIIAEGKFFILIPEYKNLLFLLKAQNVKKILNKKLIELGYQPADNRNDADFLIVLKIHAQTINQYVPETTIPLMIPQTDQTTIQGVVGNAFEGNVYLNSETTYNKLAYLKSGGYYTNRNALALRVWLFSPDGELLGVFQGAGYYDEISFLKDAEKILDHIIKKEVVPLIKKETE